jgi:hypothetical protein
MKFFQRSVATYTEKSIPIDEEDLPPTVRTWVNLNLSLRGAVMVIVLFSIAVGLKEFISGIMGITRGEPIAHLGVIQVTFGAIQLVMAAMATVAIRTRLSVRQHVE